MTHLLQQNTYPGQPGYRGLTDASQQTSKAAARAVATKARTQRQRVLDSLKAAYPAGLTSEEIGSRTGMTVYPIRSRVAELQAEGLVVGTDDSRMGHAGLKITVWQYVGGAHVG